MEKIKFILFFENPSSLSFLEKSFWGVRTSGLNNPESWGRVKINFIKY